MIVRTLLRPIAGVLAVLGLATGLGHARPARAAGTTSLAAVLASRDWLNGEPSARSLSGEVVVVDIFTFGCFNCKNVTPNLQTLHRERGVAVVGIHTPETDFERDPSHVATALASLGIVWPVAIDNDGVLWRAYGAEYWPTQLIFDKHGTLRDTIVGDSQDRTVDADVRALLAEK